MKTLWYVYEWYLFQKTLCKPLIISLRLILSQDVKNKVNSQYNASNEGYERWN